MRAFELASVLSLVVSLACPATSARHPIPSSDSSANQDSRNHSVSVSRNNGSSGLSYSHANNNEYTATIYVNGVPYQASVILDTGSSDTWIDPWSQGVSEPDDLFQLGINSTTTYVDGTVSTGPIVLADVSFGPYTVKNQAITVAYNASPAPEMYNGLIGLGGVAKSEIYGLLANSSWVENGTPILYNLFEHEPDLPNYTAFLMSRSEVGITSGGVLTISEVLSNMTSVLDAPLFQSPVASQWTTVMDGLYVNGEFVNGYSNFSSLFREHNVSVPNGGLIATFDTGTSYVRGPPEYVHAIFKDVTGAELIDPSTGLVRPGEVMYSVPCDTKVNITWSFRGSLYPMHPVDAIDAIGVLESGDILCIGTITGGANPLEDFLVGASFLRNTYQLYDYGDLDQLAAKPYTRLLSVTDTDKAWAEADALNSARVAAFKDANLSATDSLASTTATERPAFIGTTAAVALTSIDDENGSATLTASATPLPKGTPSSTDKASESASFATSSPDSASSTGSVSSNDSTSSTDDSSVRFAAGALSEDGSSSGTSSVNLSTLTRNSYIIIGLAGGAVLLLFVILVLVVKANRANQGYRAVPSNRIARPGGLKMYEDDAEPYSTPYDSR
ncbi:aspartic peptidase domain-containing protein [Trametes meyenii]|nr:aspartic peptidase domain-containing protein [Trametes meyenii]